MKEKISCIYKITSPSERVYIGQAVDIRRRIYRYNSLDTQEQVKLHRSFLKYGLGKHTFQIIEECPEQELNKRERFWQEYYGCVDNGLNCFYTETDTQPRVYSKEWRQAASERSSGENNGMFGYQWSEEQREKQSQAIKEVWKNKAHPWIGKSHSGYTIELIRKTKIETEAAKGGKNPKAKIVMCTMTGIFYDCIKDAAEAFNIKAGTLRSWLNPNCSNKNKTTLVYV